MQSINWRAIGRATQLFLMAAGIVGLVIWFTTSPAWVDALTVLCAGVAWYLFYVIACRIHYRSKVPQSRRGKSPVGGRTALREVIPPEKKYYVYTDDTGNPVYAAQ